VERGGAEMVLGIEAKQALRMLDAIDAAKLAAAAKRDAAPAGDRAYQQGIIRGLRLAGRAMSAAIMGDLPKGKEGV
jgi:hypothetical protein